MILSCPPSRRAAKIKAFELHALADTAIVKTYAPGAVITRQGDAVNRFYIVREGCVSASNGTSLQVCDHFGEVEIFTKRASEGTMTASSVRGAVCLEWALGHFVAYAAAPGLPAAAQPRALIAARVATCNRVPDGNGFQAAPRGAAPACRAGRPFP